MRSVEHLIQPQPEHLDTASHCSSTELSSPLGVCRWGGGRAAVYSSHSASPRPPRWRDRDVTEGGWEETWGENVENPRGVHHTSCGRPQRERPGERRRVHPDRLLTLRPLQTRDGRGRGTFESFADLQLNVCGESLLLLDLYVWTLFITKIR